MYLKAELYELIRTDERIFDFIQESALDGLWYWDLENPENEWMNSKFWTVLGYHPDEMPHKSSAWQSIINQDDLKLASDNFTKHCKNPNYPYDQIVRYTHKDGSTIWIRCRGLAIRDKNGKPTRMLGAHQDVTELKRSEQELLKANEKVHKSEAKLSALFSSMSEMVVLHKLVYDRKGKPVNYQIIDCNDAFTRITGITQNEALGQLSTEVYGTLEPPFLKEYAEVVRTGKPHHYETYFQPMNKHFSISVIRPEKDHFATVTTDITEHKQSEFLHQEKSEEIAVQSEELVVQNEELIEANRELIVAKEEAEKSEEKYRTLFENLKQERILLRTIINSIPDAIYVKDLESRKVLANTADCKNCGFEKEEELIGKTDFDIFPAEIAQALLDEDSKVIKEGLSVINREEYIKRPTFDEKYLLTSKLPLCNDKGEIIGLVGIGHDITERKQDEEKLKLLNHAIEASSTSVVITDAKGHIDYINPYFTKLTGYSYEEVIGKNPRFLNSGYHPKTFYEELWNTILSGKEWKGEFQNRKKNGELYWEDAVISPILNSKGVVTNIVAIKDDITERKKMLEDLVSSKEKAEESEAKLKEAQRIAHMGNWELNIETNELFWSDEIFRIFDCEPQEFIATYESFLDFIHPEDRAKVNSAYLNSLETKTGYQIEHRLITKSHQIKYVREKCATTFNEQGNPLISFGIVIDITEQKELENALLKSKERAEESERLKTAFLANMSHEIRTPMNGILGFADLLKEPDLEGDDQLKYIGIIEKSGERMLNIINDIIDISKIESGLMELNMRETNVNEQIEFIYSFFKPEAEDKGMNLSYHTPLPANEANIRTDREKVYAILTNLAKNALKYTEKGSIELGYHLKTDSETGELEFYVKDTGVGISKDKQQAIFERFIRADTADKLAHQGAGLGLSISKAYVEMLGGRIRVESEEGTGSAFYFTLPYNPELVTEAIDGKHPPSGKNKTIRNLKILIAEDDEVSEILLDEIVKMFGTENLKARTGVEAVEVCRRNPDIDLILMDINMPDIGGYQATQQIRAFNKDVVIIAQTAYGLTGDREKCLESGCNDYIAKPISKTAMQALITKYFG